MTLPNWTKHKMGLGFGKCHFLFWNEKLINLQYHPNYVGPEHFVFIKSKIPEMQPTIVTVSLQHR